MKEFIRTPLSMHNQNIQKLDIWLFKVVSDRNTEIVNEIPLRNEGVHELRQKNFFSSPQ